MNSFALVCLGTMAFAFFPKTLKKSFPLIWVGSGILLWLTGRYGIHVGASALVYGLFHLIFWLSLFRLDRKSLAALWLPHLVLVIFFLHLYLKMM
jgi:membrane associated rhomboid family serine protease